MNYIKRIYKRLIDESKVYIPVAIDVVEALKLVLDSPVDDIVLDVIGILIPNLPKNKIDVIKDKIHAELPKILIELNLINAATNSTDINEQLKGILEALKIASEDTKAEKYHILASKLLVILSDGKISWSESVIFTEWYYQTHIKK